MPNVKEINFIKTEKKITSHFVQSIAFNVRVGDVPGLPAGEIGHDIRFVALPCVICILVLTESVYPVNNNFRHNQN